LQRSRNRFLLHSSIAVSLCKHQDTNRKGKDKP
jgi:hypothetical protein